MAGTNNFEVFDENQTNMMADTDYVNSADRANGVYDGLADPTLSNKTWYQASIMAAAIAGMAADKGVNISDTSLTALKASILSAMAYQTAGGTATAITLTLPALVNGYSVTFIAAANNSGAATTVNGIPLYKPGTTTAPTLIAGKAYTIWYSSSNNRFFLKASAEGTAVAANVLAGKTFSNDSDTGIAGTMDLSNLIPGNIKSGVTIDGVTGTYTITVSHGMNVYLTPGAYTWTAPGNVGVVLVDLWGGGGAGGSTTSGSTSAGGGGGGGGYRRVFISVTPGATYTVNVGAGGQPVANAAGTAGGASSFGSYSIGGGGGGRGGASYSSNPSTGTGGGGGAGSDYSTSHGTYGGSGGFYPNGVAETGGSSGGTLTNGFFALDVIMGGSGGVDWETNYEGSGGAGGASGSPGGAGRAGIASNAPPTRPGLNAFDGGQGGSGAYIDSWYDTSVHTYYYPAGGGYFPGGGGGGGCYSSSIISGAAGGTGMVIINY